LVPARQWSCSVLDAAAIAFSSSLALIPYQPIMILVCGPIRRNSRSMLDFVIETQPAVAEKLERAKCRNTALPRPATRGPAL